ncbi:MAG: response regulator [Thermodesulfobacteria bacterium]|nr:response regulator [Thermodesulfobacteriota bacterium]
MKGALAIRRRLLARLNATVLVLLVILVSVSLTVGATLWGTYVVQKELAREREENLKTLLLHTVRVIEPHVKLLVRSEIERVADELLQFEFIKGVRIVWQEPSIYGDIREMDILLGRHPSNPPERLQISKGDLEGEIFSLPIIDQGEVIGRLEVAVDDRLHQELIHHLLERFLFVGLFISFLVGGLLYLYYRLVSHPALALAKHMEQAPEKLLPFPEVPGPKEIRVLVESYNHLVERLNHYREELKAAMRRWQEEATRAEAASRAKTTFLANITHELRTPMTAALGMAELLADGSLPSEERQYVDNLRNSLKTLSGLIEDVLSFARLEAERENVREEVFDLHALLEDLRKLFEPQFRSQGLYLKLEIAPDLPRLVKGDEAKIRQVLINLLGNALKFTMKGGAVLSARVVQRNEGLVHVEFAVKDTGVGIPEDALERIFIPFERLAPESIPGTGLGLSISQHLARMLGGSIEVKSEGPGHGATFYFRVPLKLVEGERPEAPKVEKLSGRVLLAEDNAVTRHFFVKILEKLGLSVVAVADGNQALEEALKGDFDLVLLDIRMPGLDGLEVARRLRAAGFRKPILAITAHAVSEVEAESLRAGMDGFITKPISREELWRHLSRWLS